VTIGYRSCRVDFLVSGSLVLAGERFRRIVDDEKEDDGTQDDEHVSLNDDAVVGVGTENRIKTLQFGGIKICINNYYDEHVSLNDDSVVRIGTENKMKTLQFGGIKTCLIVYFFY
jgi:hypothetical protein